MERKRKVEGKLDRKTLVELYSDVGSQAYAPLTRIGVFFDRNSDQYAVKSKYLTTLNGTVTSSYIKDSFELFDLMRIHFMNYNEMATNLEHQTSHQ